SEYFRTVEFEQDLVDDVTAFMSYNTGLLPSGGPARVLTVTSAYAEAGIELVDTGYADTVPIALAGSNRMWADRELHTAMLDHFRRWTPDAAWRVWMLAATAHEDPRR